MRTENVDAMRKTFWGGGTVALAASSDDFHVLKCRPSDKFEDGTLSFLDIIALQHGFDYLEGTLGGVEKIEAHTRALAREAFERFAALRHSNGAPVVKIFGRHAAPGAAPAVMAAAPQGAIVNFEVLDPEGGEFSYRYVERVAADAGFHIRAGALPLRCLRSAARAARGRPLSPGPLRVAGRGAASAFRRPVRYGRRVLRHRRHSGRDCGEVADMVQLYCCRHSVQSRRGVPRHWRHRGRGRDACGAD
jgi:selenocysteine lyase/cysteine desulfurase